MLKRRIVENTHENCSEKQEEKYYLLLPHSCEEFSKKLRLGKNYDEINSDIVLSPFLVQFKSIKKTILNSFPITKLTRRLKNSVAFIYEIVARD